jgi:hypothetical protein
MRRGSEDAASERLAFESTLEENTEDEEDIGDG